MHPFINQIRTHQSHLATAFTFYTQQSSSPPKKTTMDAITDAAKQSKRIPTGNATPRKGKNKKKLKKKQEEEK
jgi:hypothetical protein